MEKAHSRIKWENYPSIATPLNETNLNKMDVALDEVDNRVLGLDTAKLDKATANTMVKDISFAENTGIFTITLLNGTKKTIDTKLEKIATNFSYDYQTQKLKLTLVDGTIQELDLTSLISQVEFMGSDTIDISVDSTGKVSAIVKDGSITEAKLQPNYLAEVKVEVAKAKSSSDSSYENAETARESATEARQFRDEAEQFRNQAEAMSGINIATTEIAGIVKPDGATIRVDPDGTIHADRGTTSYTDLENKPKINDVVLEGNKTIDGLGGLTAESTVSFSQSSERTNIEATDNVKGIFGKVKKWFADLKPHAFSNPTNNLLATEPGTPLDAVQGKVLGDKLGSYSFNTSVIDSNTIYGNRIMFGILAKSSEVESISDYFIKLGISTNNTILDVMEKICQTEVRMEFIKINFNWNNSTFNQSLPLVNPGVLEIYRGEATRAILKLNYIDGDQYINTYANGALGTWQKLVTETALNASFKTKLSHREYIAWTRITAGSYAEGVHRFTKGNIGHIKEFIFVLEETSLYGNSAAFEYVSIKTAYANLLSGYYQVITSKGVFRIYYKELEYVDIREIPQGLQMRGAQYLPTY